MVSFITYSYVGIYPTLSLLNAVHHDHHQAMFALEQFLNGDIAMYQYALISIQLFGPISSIVPLLLYMPCIKYARLEELNSSICYITAS